MCIMWIFISWVDTDLFIEKMDYFDLFVLRKYTLPSIHTKKPTEIYFNSYIFKKKSLFYKSSTKQCFIIYI